MHNFVFPSIHYNKGNWSCLFISFENRFRTGLWKGQKRNKQKIVVCEWKVKMLGTTRLRVYCTLFVFCKFAFFYIRFLWIAVNSVKLLNWEISFFSKVNFRIHFDLLLISKLHIGIHLPLSYKTTFSIAFQC